MYTGGIIYIKADMASSKMFKKKILYNSFGTLAKFGRTLLNSCYFMPRLRQKLSNDLRGWKMKNSPGGMPPDLITIISTKSTTDVLKKCMK